MNPEDSLKSLWHDMDSSLGSIEDTNQRLADDIAQGRIRSNRDYVMARMRVLSLVCFLCPWWLLLNTDLGLSVAFKWVFIGYFLLTGGMFIVTMLKLKAIDPATMTPAEIERRVKIVERHRLIKKMVAIPLCAVLIVWLIISLAHIGDTMVIAGCIAGAVVGAVLGLLIDRRIRRSLRGMRS